MNCQNVVGLLGQDCLVMNPGSVFWSPLLRFASIPGLLRASGVGRNVPGPPGNQNFQGCGIEIVPLSPYYCSPF
jgi:hypothetical protein